MENKHLAWFLGPKAENAEIFTTTLMNIVQDYIHWRRNYYPSDSLLVTKKIQRENEVEFDKLQQGVTEMMSLLRRNFPFYSPRYIGHMLSDISMPSMFGYFAGMLHNSNNVTPEAAPVTVEWEIEACNEVIKMLGYKPSPTPPTKDANIQDWQNYKKELKGEFGWAHITSGGTVANIEAIWVARIIKYFPLAIQEVAIQKNLSIEIKFPNPDENIIDIKEISKEKLISIKPNEAIYLFARMIDALSKANNISISKASELSGQLLSKSKYSLSGNLGTIFSEFPPVIFASGAAHYSIKKAADILGIGRDNVILVKTDGQFRMDVIDLEAKINSALKAGKYPLAVVAVGSTTEEGAVDPVHEIVDLRKKFEKQNISFWLHVDSAWGGYISSIFRLDDEEEAQILITKIAKKLKLKFNHGGDYTTIEKMSFLISKTTDAIYIKKNYAEKDKLKTKEEYEKEKDLLGRLLKELNIHVKLNDFKSFHIGFRKLMFDFGSKLYVTEDLKIMDVLKKEDFEISITDRADSTADYVSDAVSFSLKNYQKEKEIKWGAKYIISSFLAFKNADSITIDPHKLGYIQYPCGLVAFKNDRIRHFIMQRAPYITSTGHNALLHNPPRHVVNIDFEKLDNQNLPYDDYQISIDAFAPFMLEGSKPGAAAAALWFASKMIPLDRKNHGQIIRDSIIATRELYEWLFTWDKIYDEAGINDKLLYEFKTFGSVPDTNVFVFTLKNKMDDTIEGMNKLTQEVYNYFTIQAELGSKDHSYSQSFFISKTKMDDTYYSYDAFKGFFEDCGLKNYKKDYLEKGLLVLRATVMNPYITAIRRTTKQNLIKEFVWELHKAANESVKKLVK